MTRTGKLFLILSIFFISLGAHALLSVQASVDSNQTTVEEGITLTVSVISSDSVEVESPRLESLNGFRLDNTWDTTAVSQKMVSGSSGMQWEAQRRRDFNFTLTPMRPGRLSIPGLEVKVNGQVYHTQPIVVEVSESQQGGPRGGQGRRGQQRPRQNVFPPGMNLPSNLDDIDRLEEEMFNQLLNRQGGMRGQPGPGVPGAGGAQPRNQPEPQLRTLPQNPNEAFFVQVEVDKLEVYEGEQITASWYIYTRGQMESLDRVKFPDLKNFWKEIIEEVPTIQFMEEVVNGIPYRKALLASHALFPIKPGNAVIDEYKIKSRVRTLQQNAFGTGFGQAYEFTRSSQRVNIKVKPLPVEGRPQDFAGAVGNFEVQTSVDGQKFPLNQPFNLRIRFEGFGNAKMIELPAIDWPKTIEVYDTKAESKFFKDGRSYKQFDVLMIPREKGILHIPEITLSLFDPHTKKYYQKKTSAIDLEISENPNAPATATGPSGQPVEAVSQKSKGPQLPPLVAEMSYENPLAALAGHAGVVGGFYLAVILGLILKARRELGWGRRKKSLQDLIDRRFKKVEAAYKAQDHRKMGAELMNVFYFLLGEATGQGGAVQELDRLLDLVPPSVRRDLGEPLKKAFSTYQVLSFAPEELVQAYKSPDNLKKTLKEARELSQKLLSALLSQAPEQQA